MVPAARSLLLSVARQRACAFSRAGAPSLRPSLWQRAAVAEAVRTYHVAVVGSGPAGFYTSKYLMKEANSPKSKLGSLHVDMFERLPTPFGLVRFGVAPDHPEVKNVINDFDDVASLETFRFFGNVEVGKDITLDNLRSMYDAVVMCHGAQGERVLGIPGEDLSGVVGAPAFVKWYNGHPDHSALDLSPPGETAVVIGQGNVALDVARLLTRPPKELHPTDIDAKALARIGEWQRDGLRTVHVVGRRGFVQAAFTNAELRELLTISEEVLPIVDPEELALSQNEASKEELKSNRAKKRSLSILEKMAANFEQRHTTSKRVIWLRFLSSPSAFLAAEGESSKLGALRLDRTELSGEPGKQSAVKSASASLEDVPCGLVVRSVGFDLEPLEGLPLDARKRVPHSGGKVEPGLYISGWAKRGPTGIIGSNVADARETAATILQDLGKLDNPKGAAGVDATLAGHRVVSFADWKKLEAEEHRRGAADGRSASKMTDVQEMLNLLA